MLGEANAYQRAIQHQQLSLSVFGAARPPGFVVEVKPSYLGFQGIGSKYLCAAAGPLCGLYVIFRNK